MKRYNEGLVIGKFYPPHLGHHYLINSALEQSEHVTVLVMGTLFDTVSLETRVRMIKAVHHFGNITVKAVIDHIYDDYESKAIWVAHQTLIDNSLDIKPDALFTSEKYGDELAGYLNAEHVCVDISRSHVPISATAVRSDLYGNWDFLNPVVRNHFRTNVVVMGGESTGTTTLSRGLTEHFRSLGGNYATTAYVPEYGREYAEKRIESQGVRELTWRSKDFWRIAEGQQRLYADLYNSSPSPVIVCDTDGLATEAFGPYYGVPSGEEGVTDYGYFSMMNPGDIYLITDHQNMPLEDDGSRLEDVMARDKSTKDFIAVCHKYKVPYALVTGTREERLEVAIKIVRRVMEMKALMRPPV